MKDTMTAYRDIVYKTTGFVAVAIGWLLTAKDA
jgi:hypothetical protein